MDSDDDIEIVEQQPELIVIDDDEDDKPKLNFENWLKIDFLDLWISCTCIVYNNMKTEK